MLAGLQVESISKETEDLKEGFRQLESDLSACASEKAALAHALAEANEQAVVAKSEMELLDQRIRQLETEVAAAMTAKKLADDALAAEVPAFVGCRIKSSVLEGQPSPCLCPTLPTGYRKKEGFCQAR